jgi:FkbM family methyltransferase
MISPDIFPVYAQYNEDVILAALLADVTKGFYVDVGANHETYHSVTRYFYDRGWSGINIEPIPRLIEEIADKRKRDINLQLAISTEPGEMNFREYPEHDGLSTLSSDSKADPTKQDIPHTDYTIKVEPLRAVFKQQKVSAIDFLKIDVEGYEKEVLQSNDWHKYRPTVIAIEANHRSDDWSEYLRDKDYDRVIFDGLNEYYLDHSMRPKMDGFAERATLLAHSAVRSHHLDQWRDDVDRMQQLDEMTKRQDALIKDMEKEARHLRPHVLIDKPYLTRIKVAVYDLSLGYIKQRLAK